MRFTHDCEHCIPLGEYGDADLYYHPGEVETVIARYGDKESDYGSGLALADKIDDLGEAKKRAIAKGLI